MPLHALALVPRRSALIEPDVSDRSNRRWRPFSGTVAIGWVATLVACAAVGGLITGAFSDTALVRWDRRYPVELEAARTASWNMWSDYGSLIGDTLVVVAVAVSVGVVLLILKRWASVLLIAVAMLSEVSIFVATTLIIPRSRPSVEQMDVSPPTSSFPSGHTAAATALALTLAIVVGWHVRAPAMRACAWLVAFAIGPIVGLSRIYRGMHHPLDVVVGLSLGVACVLLAYLAVRAWVGDASAKQQRSERTEQESPDMSSYSDSRLAS